MPEETPEQVMSRLARYADTLRRSPGAPIDEAARRAVLKVGTMPGRLPPRSALQSLARRAPPPSAAPRPHASMSVRPPTPASVTSIVAAVPAYVPVSTPPPASHAQNAGARFVFAAPGLADVRVTILGQVLGFVGGVAAIFAFLLLGSIAASIIVLAAVAVGVVAIRRHWALAWWWTLGVLGGGLVGRFS